jgi:peptidoglycan hydrolase FlgJ
MSMSGIGPGGPAAALPRTDTLDERLRTVASRMEGVFVEQLFKAMRATVEPGGLTSESLGEDLFTGMMDQTIADQAAQGLDRGIGGALYRQLRARIQQPQNGQNG